MNWRSPARLALAVVFLTGCGIRADEEPRAIPGAEPVVDPAAGSGEASTGADRIFLVGPGESRALRSVPRSAAGSPRNLIEILLDGPNEEELEDGWSSQIPADTQLLSSEQQGTVLFLDLTSQLTALPPRVQPQALAQIVYTATEAEGVSTVQITIEGEPQALPTGIGEATTEDLSPYDYPGFVASAQPAYPALPAG